MSKVFMDSADPIVIEDLEGRIIDINDEAINTYGWTHEAIIGKPTLTLVPEDRHKHIEALQEQCRKGKPIRNAEELFIHRSGTIIPVLLTFSLLSGKDGEIAAIATIAKKYTHSLARKIGV
jgi:PAS domain S-box-containing protein